MDALGCLILGLTPLTSMDLPATQGSSRAAGAFHVTDAKRRDPALLPDVR